MAAFHVRYLAETQFLLVDEDGPSASADACRQAMQVLIDRSMERAKQILQQNKSALMALADQLDRRETLYGSDVDRILRSTGVKLTQVPKFGKLIRP